MRISIIVAMDEKRGIGLDNHLPWRLSSDLRRFKRLTMGHHLIMGRKTFESIGRPLPGRVNIVLTRNPDYQAPGCCLAHSLEEALAIARASGEEEVFIIGGAAVFAQALPLADRIYLTLVQAEVEADTFFEAFDERAWVAVESQFQPADERDEFPSVFQMLIPADSVER